MTGTKRPHVSQRLLAPMGLSAALARQVRARRVERGWTQDDLGRALSKTGWRCSRTTVVSLERARRVRIGVDELYCIAAAFDVSWAAMLRTAIEDARAQGELP